MTVYADVLAVVNLYVDFFLLWCVKKVLRLDRRDRRLLLGAVAGSVFSLLSLLGMGPALSLLVGAAAALGTTAVAFCPLPPRMLFRAALCFWAFSLALAGFFLFLLRFCAPGRVALLGTVVYFDLSPGLLFVFTCGAYVLFSLGRRLLPRPSPEGRFCTLVIENRGKEARVFAKADTGNSLREPFSGLPVVVCQAEALKDAAPPEALSYLETGKVEAPDGNPMGKLRLVPFETLAGNGLLPAFRPRRVALEKGGPPLDCWVALCARPLSAGQFNALYNPDQF